MMWSRFKHRHKKSIRQGGERTPMVDLMGECERNQRKSWAGGLGNAVPQIYWDIELNFFYERELCPHAPGTPCMISICLYEKMLFVNVTFIHSFHLGYTLAIETKSYRYLLGDLIGASSVC